MSRRNTSSSSNSGGGLIWALLRGLLGSSDTRRPTKTEGQRSTELNNTGVERANQGDHEAAVKLYKKALRMDTKNQVCRKNITIALNQLGLEAFKDGDYGHAVERFDEALAYDPDNQILRRNLAISLARLGLEASNEGDLRAAEKKFEEAIYFDPDSREIQDGLRYCRERLADQTRLSEVEPVLKKMLDRFATDLEQSGWAHEASVVDLTFLNPDLPIVVDPNVVKGKPRRIPQQSGLYTPKGVDYDKGFEELKSGNPAAAIEFFKKAATENPDNPCVRNALDLANDLVKVRQDAARNQEEQERFSKARLAFVDSVDAMRKGDLASAGNLLFRAQNTNPSDSDLLETSKSMQMYLYWAEKGQSSSTTPEADKKLYAAVAERSSMVMTAMILKDYQRALNELDAADALFANNIWVDMYLPAEGGEKPTRQAEKSDLLNLAMMREGLTAARKQAARLLSRKSN